MSRQKKHEHVNHERWLVSYADFITLLFAFFVVLFSSSQKDRKKQQQLAEAMQQAFEQNGSFSVRALHPTPGKSMGSSTVKVDQAEEEILRARICQVVDAMHKSKSTHGAASGEATDDLIRLRKAHDGLVLSLKEAGFFDSGSAVIRTNSIPLLEKIAQALPIGPIRVEGHTDNIAIHSGNYTSNWELSTARASAIAHILLENGKLNPAEFSIAGYGEYHPVASNDTEQGRAMNRRVDIVLLKTKPEDSATPQTKQETVAISSPQTPSR